MRVALISPLVESVPPKLYGGTERVVYNLCRGLSKAGVEMTVFASGDSDLPCEIVPVVPEALRLCRRKVDPIPYYFKMLAEVARQASRYDVIHNHHDYWMLPLTEMSQVPVLTTVHGRMDVPDISAAFFGYPKAFYVSISDSQRVPMPELRWLRTIYHGLDLDTLRYYPKPGQYLAFLGRISPEKRPEWAIEIARRAGVPLKIAAKIEGKEGKDYYDACVKPYVDGKNIEFIGEISEKEKSEFLGNALALVFPIDWPEPFGLVMIESLACGTPVLARPCGAACEILKDGITGFLSPDILELARRVADLGRIERGECRRWAETRFSLKRMTEEYIHVYRHLSEFSGARTAKRRESHRNRRDFLHPVQRFADGNT